MTTQKEERGSVSDAIKALVENQREANIYIRHYEETRFKITQMTITLSGLLVGALRFGDPHRNTAHLFGIFIIILGILGAVISIKYTERADRHASLARAYRRAASDLIGEIGNSNLEEIHLKAVDVHAQGIWIDRIFNNMRARLFWIGIHVCMVILGAIVATF